MSQLDKSRERIKKVPADLTWDELISFLASLGYNQLSSGKTSGSRRKFMNDKKEIITLHKPHPGNIVKRYAIRQVLDILGERGQL